MVPVAVVPLVVALQQGRKVSSPDQPTYSHRSLLVTVQGREGPIAIQTIYSLSYHIKNYLSTRKLSTGVSSDEMAYFSHILDFYENS